MPGRSGLKQPEAPWRPFVFAHVVLDNDERGPEWAEEAERKAGRVLKGARYLDFVCVGGYGLRTGVDEAGRILGLNVPVLTELALIRNGGHVRLGLPLPGVRVVCFVEGNPRVPMPMAGRLREEVALAHGEIVITKCEGALAEALVASIGGQPLPFRPSGPVPESPREVQEMLSVRDPARFDSLIYEIEATPRIRVVVAPGTEAAVLRRAGLVYLITPPVTGGKIRLGSVEGYRLRTWLRSIETGEDEPAAEFPLRGP